MLIDFVGQIETQAPQTEHAASLITGCGTLPTWNLNAIAA